MLNFVYRLLYLITGICWLNIWLIQALVALVLVGPKKLFDKSKENEPPAALHDPVYGEHKSVTVNKVKLHYVVSGPTQAPLMLMLHGFPEIWYSWRYQIKEFQKDFRVVAVDMRGYGDSDKPKGLENYKMDVLVQDVQELIEALGKT
uniref:AB hydrolase-1 domain-containing protein n=1 Tax=Biomphalaria glabrata TaxID=6526 RepID=A0A2C9KII3_BIOGL